MESGTSVVHENPMTAAAAAPDRSQTPRGGTRAVRADYDGVPQAGTRFGFVLCCQVLCTCYAALILLPSSTGIGAAEWGDSAVPLNSTPTGEYPRLCPREAICSEGWYQLVLIVSARLSAYIMFPLLAVVYLTKCHSLTTMMERTIVTLWVPLSDLHQVHTAAGRAIMWLMPVHTLCHCLRWADRSELGLLLSTPAGGSGLVAVLCAGPICLLMGGPAWIMAALRWEVRKTAHLLSVPFGIALLWHTPRMLVFFTAVMGVYGADQLFTVLAKTYHIDKPEFTRLANAVIVTFANPPGWQNHGIGYINVLVPWISRFQHHPFSVYPHPRRQNYSCVCINNEGDWTRKLHEILTRPTTRPVWVSGPFSSPYQFASNYDSLMLVATGVGITPALSCFEHHRSNRKVSLLWMCRDPSLIEFFLDVFTFDDDGFTLIFYTGKTSLRLPQNMPSTLYVFPGRPDIQTVIGSVIQSVDEGLSLPSDLLQQSMAFMIKHLAQTSELELATGAAQRVTTMMKQLLQSGVSLQTIVGAFDTDDSNSIDVDELNSGLTSLNIRLETSELEDLINVIDKDHTGDICVGEWIDFIEARVQVSSAEPESARAQAVAQWRSMTTGESARAKLLKILVRHGAHTLYDEMNRGEVNQLSKSDVEQGVARVATTANIDLPQSSCDAVVAILTSGSATVRYCDFAEGFSMLQGLRVYMRRAATSSAMGRSGRRSVDEHVPQSNKWMFLYCGGSRPVMEALDEISSKHGIKYIAESFRW